MVCVCSCLTKLVPFPLSWKVWLLISRFWVWKQRSKEDRKHWSLPGVWVGVVGGVALLVVLVVKAVEERKVEQEHSKTISLGGERKRKMVEKVHLLDLK